MRFLHTSDWHLGARLGEYSRLAEQREVLAEIRAVAGESEVDFVIIAGDIFDNFNPPNEAVDLLYRELKKLADDSRRPVIVIAGNHDSPDRIESPDPLAVECGIFFIGYPDFTRSKVELESGIVVDFPEMGIVAINFPDKPQVRILTTPYANENRLRKYLESEKRKELIAGLLGERWKQLAGRFCDSNGVNILTAHLFMADNNDLEDKPEDEPDEERSILHPGGLELVEASIVPSQVQYTALGHLHRPQTVRAGRSPVVYSGSPLSFGLSEEDQQKSVAIVEVDTGKPAVIERRPLSSGKRILRKTFSEVGEAVHWLTENQNVYVELLIECDKYISAEERRQLFCAHEGITAVIPVSQNETDELEASERLAPDLTESMEELFKSFFEYTKGVQPNSSIVELFREIASVADTDTGAGAGENEA